MPLIINMRSRTALALALVCGAIGCNNRQSIIVPNRVLDRPTEMALACVTRDPDSEVIRTVSLESCQAATCGDTRLIGFVANSEKDDVAMFSTCANSVIDMDVATPGAQLIPAGKVPTSMAMTIGSPDACFAVSGNLGSCDLSTFDVTGFAAYAWDEAPVEDPSSLVQTIVPTRGDGTPLGARPGQIIPVPLELTNSVLFGDPTPAGESSGEDDGGDEGTGDPTGGSGAPVVRCDPERPGSVYVTFPSCQLVAEVDLRTHRILQSRQFMRDEDGVVEVVDSGVDPQCPIDCPEQFLDHPEALAAAPAGEADGMYPSALALVSPPRIDPENPDAELLYDEADKQIVDHSLYVGGLGDDTLFELRYDGTRWTDDPLTLELQSASGVQVIRPTPAMELPLDGSEPYHQFLYVITGDGSTRVVRREFDTNRTELGLECDTQVDPTAVLGRVCHPAEFPGEDPPSRRPFSRGPGIRTLDRSLVTDWTFQKLIRCEEGQGTGKAKSVPPFPRYCLDVSVAANDETAALSSPFGQVGVVGVGTTSYGRLVYVTFGQFFTKADGTIGRNPVVSTLVDPLGLLDATILPHMLWPTLDPTLPDVDPLGLPRMADLAPVRVLPGKSEDADAIKVLAPALRRIDMAYTDRTRTCDVAGDCVTSICGVAGEEGYDACVEDLCDGQPCVCTKDDPEDCKPVVSCIGGKCQAEGMAQIPQLSIVENADSFGNPEAGDPGEQGLYTKEVVRAVVRDYTAWSDIEWTLQWEGEIPGSESVQGQLVCDKPGWEGGTCLSTEPGDTRIVDGTADFCNVGVLAGDRLALYACDADSQCGEGQYCLVDPRTPGNASGICVSQESYADKDRLLQVCQDMVYDPCGPPRREFLITRAFKDEIWLQAMDKPITSYLMFHESTLPDSEDVPVDADVCSGKYIDDVVRNPEGHASDPDALESQFTECEGRLICAENQPESGCETHADCVTQSHEDEDPEDPKDFSKEVFPLCIDGLCRRVCGPDEDCVLRRLPGPACMRELIHYTVTARNSFVLRGQGAYSFLTQRVKTDPETGECYDDPAMSNLLTSRIRLGKDEADTRNNTAWPIPSCPTGTERPDGGAPNPCFIEVDRPDSIGDNSPERLFHRLLYGKGPVPAIRFSNPMMSVVLDLTSVQALTDPIPGREEKPWPTPYREFKRSRIPRNFTESFTTLQGYRPFNNAVITSNIALIGPTRIINAPEASTVFIVDTSGGAGTSGVRGQLVRVTLAGGQVSPDTYFQVH